jgi:hypothetical protein
MIPQKIAHQDIIINFMCPATQYTLLNQNIHNGGQVEGRLERTQSERNDTNEHQRALKLKRIHADASLREHPVASWNLHAPTVGDRQIRACTQLWHTEVPLIADEIAAVPRTAGQSH